MKRPEKQKSDLIEKLIEVSDKCMTMHPRIDKRKKVVEFGCSCRKYVHWMVGRMMRLEYERGVNDGIAELRKLIR